MGTHMIERTRDASKLGKGFFGIDKYLPADGLELCHFFGTNYPDNLRRDRWDYSLNERHAVNKGALVNGDAMLGGYYDLGLSPAQLGSGGKTLWAVALRDAGKAAGHTAVYIGNFGDGIPLSLTLGTLTGTPAGAHIFYVNGTNGGIATTASIPFGDRSGVGYELIVATLSAAGVPLLYRRSPVEASVSAPGTAALPGVTFGSTRFRAGLAYSGDFAVGDATAAVGAYSRALSLTDIDLLYAGLQQFLARYGGPAI